jgi:ABC-type phosphate transport system substrate-binding protein
MLPMLLSLVLLAGLAQARQLAVVADRANTTGNVKTSDLASILTGKTKSWFDGKPIKVVLRNPSSPNTELVVRLVLNMTSEQFQTWMQAHPGQVVLADSDDAVLRFVAATRGAIGIVDLYSLTKDVTVVKIDGKLPFDTGYLLKGN